MLILGISAFGQNPAACLWRDGRLLSFAEEERFVRIKGAFGRFPAKAAEYCLAEAGESVDALTAVAVGWDARKYSWRMPLFFARQRLAYGAGEGGAGQVLKELVDQRPDVVRDRIARALRRELGGKDLPKIVFTGHHLAHAASAFWASGFPDAAVLVLDGSGEELSTSWYAGAGTRLEERGRVELPHSLGWFFAAVTAYLGFEPYQDEGFVMGLAPFGRPNAQIEERMARVLALDPSGLYRVDPRWTRLGGHAFDEHFSDALIELLGPPRLPSEPLADRHRDIARAAQLRLEQAALGLARLATDRGRIRRLCLAGGVALNCKMNGALAASGLVDELFVQPAAHDAGTALGAALVCAAELGADPRCRMDHAALGPGFTTGQAREALENAGARFREPADVAETAAEAVAQGKVVGWFQGRMEAGPRALGGRSILADASAPGMNDRVNARVKQRDAWRPFCPSLAEEEAARLLDAPKEARFMTVAYGVRESARERLRAVTHVDGTTRPQSVSRAVDARFYRLLAEVGRRTGTPGVLNTSFNVKGEPMACAPRDALRCFFSSGLDALALEGLWVEKA